MFGQDGSCPALLEDPGPAFPYGAVTRCGPPFQTVPVALTQAAGLVRVRSPLLTESRLMSVPPATEMFQFAGFASHAYGFSLGYPRVKPAGGLPHSETPGSPIARISPGLFAACCVLHRLSVPRHPPDALVCSLPGPRTAANPAPRAGHEDTSGARARRHSTGAGAMPRGHVTTLASPFNQPRRRDGPPAISASSEPRLKVEVIGFEPTPSCLQSRRSSS
jgi:hypothetical protein